MDYEGTGVPFPIPFPGARPLRTLAWPAEVRPLQALVAACHPTRRPRPDLYYWAHPTIVADDAEGLVGYAMLSMGPSVRPDVHSIVYGIDTGVHPRARGAGLGLQLLRLRMAIGRLMGATMLVGTVHAENAPMRAIHRDLGMTEGHVVAGGLRDQTPPADALVMYALTDALDAAAEAYFEAPRRWDRPC